MVQPVTVTMPLTTVPAVGESTKMDGTEPTVKETVDDGAELGSAPEVAAVRVRVWIPKLRPAVSREYVNPTLGQPGRPGELAHTSGRLAP